MALPSQSARPVSARSPMDMARKKLGPIALGVAGIGLVVFATWLIWGRGAGSPESAMASTSIPKDSPVISPKSTTADSQDSSEKTDLVANVPTGSSTSAQNSMNSSGGANPAANPAVIPASGADAAHQEAPVIQMGASSTTHDVASTNTPSNTPTNTVATSTTNAPTANMGGVTSGSASIARSNSRMQTGLDLIAQNKPVEARESLSAALAAQGLSDADAERIRLELGKLNDRLVFGTEVVPGDPFVGTYVIQSGDALARLPKTQGLQVDWRLIQRVNKISSPEKIQVGQRVKLVKGPFHVVVHKNDFRMDVYEGNGSQKVFVKSFSVGLGEYNSTPIGVFIVKTGKLVNPEWRNPHTGEKFASKDPKNPLGTRWIPLQGLTENLKDVTGYGVHGTIEPDSIGKQASMGCVRMLPADIEVVYELLTEGVSTVEIRED